MPPQPITSRGAYICVMMYPKSEKPILEQDITIDGDVAKAQTLPSAFYTDNVLFKRSADDVFANSWQLSANALQMPGPGTVIPFTLLEGFLNEPLLWARDTENKLFCLSNVCTHRANLLVHKPGPLHNIRCGYHGRRFGLDGKLLSAPGFENSLICPSPTDDLPSPAFEFIAGLPWVNLSNQPDPAKVFGPLQERMSFFDFGRLKPVVEYDRDYEVNAHWALYCDNYLEGFHIPFVHAGLNKLLDFDAYQTELFNHAVLQTGIAEKRRDAFKLPAGHPDSGRNIAAYYWWIYPNTMLNFYPWGLSVNVVCPQSKDKTTIVFRTYISDPEAWGHGAGAGLDEVEKEDENVVENVQKGVESRLYKRGNFSPRYEKGVHHFHQMLARDLLEY